jgi:hypothetical protein
MSREKSFVPSKSQWQHSMLARDAAPAWSSARHAKVAMPASNFGAARNFRLAAGSGPSVDGRKSTVRLPVASLSKWKNILLQWRGVHW